MKKNPNKFNYIILMFLFLLLVIPSKVGALSYQNNTNTKEFTLSELDSFKFLNHLQITNNINSKYQKKFIISKVQLELLEDDIARTKNKSNFIDYILGLIPIIFLLISILIWYKYGRDKKVIETIEFYPPEGFNSLEVGFLYKGKADSKDVISLLIYLANKGYIKISETPENRLKITKLKEYDGNNINEQIFLKGLFTKQKTESLISLLNAPEENVNEVTIIDLYDTFYITIEKILSNINSKENKNKIFEQTTPKLKKVIILMIILTYLAMFVPPNLLSEEYQGLIFVFLIPIGFGFFGISEFFFSEKELIFVNGKPTYSKIRIKILGIFTSLLWIVIPSLSITYSGFLANKIYILNLIIGLLCIIGMLICIQKLPKRSSYGNEILGKLIGFKTFLETVEKEKLEDMVAKDPTYFYNILPYAYALNVSNKLIEQFKSVLLPPPNWCDDLDKFYIEKLDSIINSAVEKTKENIQNKN